MRRCLSVHLRAVAYSRAAVLLMSCRARHFLGAGLDCRLEHSASARRAEGVPASAIAAATHSSTATISH
jgi:hypothetical protein